MKSFLQLVLLVACVHASYGFTWKVCDAKKTKAGAVGLWVPDNVSLKPDPPSIGSEVSFEIAGHTDVGIDSGSIDITVFYGGVQIFAETKDLCGKTSCPIVPGPVKVTYNQELPPVAPPGEYTVQVSLKDPNLTEVMCVLVDFEIVPPSISSMFGRKSGSKSSKAVAV